ncbi:poly [ADP-ribose] polymerase 1 [Striga asiatica]|uniref:Poly [ADP-ribose] polymerase 1 n=1 Tax=Striga asiatica TaxID=4170 RepID=A0A5A7QSG2_STRAF|nr:poly [ADP-ribose] polymerase 1 [Striga asiatica]
MCQGSNSKQDSTKEENKEENPCPMEIASSSNTGPTNPGGDKPEVTPDDDGFQKVERRNKVQRRSLDGKSLIRKVNKDQRQTTPKTRKVTTIDIMAAIREPEHGPGDINSEYWGENLEAHYEDGGHQISSKTRDKTPSPWAELKIWFLDTLGYEQKRSNSSIKHCLT